MSRPATLFLLLAVALNLIAKPSHGGLIHPGNDDVHIAMGAGRNYVGAFSRGSDPGNVSFAGSITLIDDGRWGLTTKHQVLQNFNDPTSLYGAFVANFGNNIIDNPGTTFQVQAVFVHPSKDQALIYFGENAVVGVTPIQRFRGTVAIGIEGYTTGFGDRQYVNDPNVLFTGDRRSGFDVVDSASASSFRSTFNESFENSYRNFELVVRKGYSGGPFEMAQFNLLGGISTAGLNFNSYGERSIYGTLDNPWIDTQKSSIPEPTSLAMLSFSLAALARSRRRRVFRN